MDQNSSVHLKHLQKINVGKDLPHVQVRSLLVADGTRFRLRALNNPIVCSCGDKANCGPDEIPFCEEQTFGHSQNLEVLCSPSVECSDWTEAFSPSPGPSL